jgi:hypothetical protein
MATIKFIIEQIEDSAEDVANAAYREMEKTLYNANVALDDSGDYLTSNHLSHDDIYEASMEHSIKVQQEFLNNALSQITNHFNDWAMER